MGINKVVSNKGSRTLEFGWVRPPLLMGRRKVVYNIWSRALHIVYVRLYLVNGHEKSLLQQLESFT